MSTSSPSEVHSITAVPTNLTDDQHRRMRTYLIQMGLRVVLIITAALFVDGWLLWVFVAGAVILPYTAVLFANAGRDRSARDVEAVPPTMPPELPASASAPQEEIRIVEQTDDPDRKDD
ncbi:DUF3099 domain-containing protein [Isoptericola sediminis]|uniref:DUF3099 domain-containing protein n=1 Tax=Isoptericola sediminis TaxID=2733572 RepID=A0A849K5E5_9MICO|nr:DUF3099 domain-containing protein [Isoptericola sediminis]